MLTVYYPGLAVEEHPEAFYANLRPGIQILAGAELPAQPGYEVLVNGRPNRQQLEASPLLKAVVIPWAGMPQATRDLLLEFPQLEVYNLHHNAVDTAETALALLLAAARRLLPHDRALRRHDWSGRYRPNSSLRLRGRTALILGFGQIGRQLGAMLLGLGMRVLATRRTQDAVEHIAGIEVHPSIHLHDLLPQAQVVAVTLPHTPETDYLIDEAALSLMPDGALLVNIGRGPIGDQAALYQALISGKLGGAGIDVWYHYPLDEPSRSNTPVADYPFHELDNVVMSPHRAGGSAETEQLRMAELAALLNDLESGSGSARQVDVQAGY
jgi:phosphoglycerate dehydrogenase-like enzyme